MNITELRYLVAIRKWGSVSAAAKQLYAAQPNVSKALKNLEEEYGIRIFERSSTGMIPTEQGRHFIRQAERVLEEVDRLELEPAAGRAAARSCGWCCPMPPTLPMRRWIFCSRRQQRAAAGAYPGSRFHGSAGFCAAAGLSSGPAALRGGGRGLLPPLLPRRHGCTGSR